MLRRTFLKALCAAALGALAVSVDPAALVATEMSGRSRKLHCEWTLEASEDLSAYHGIADDAQVDALSREIAAEIDAEILAHFSAGREK